MLLVLVFLGVSPRYLGDQVHLDTPDICVSEVDRMYQFAQWAVSNCPMNSTHRYIQAPVLESASYRALLSQMWTFRSTDHKEDPGSWGGGIRVVGEDTWRGWDTIDQIGQNCFNIPATNCRATQQVKLLICWGFSALCWWPFGPICL